MLAPAHEVDRVEARGAVDEVDRVGEAVVAAGERARDVGVDAPAVLGVDLAGRRPRRIADSLRKNGKRPTEGGGATHTKGTKADLGLTTTLRVEYEYAYYFLVGKLNIISHSAAGGKKI